MTGFLDLPPELWNRIYFLTGTLVLRSSTDAPVPMHDGNQVIYRRFVYASYLPVQGKDPVFPPFPPIHPNITQTCQQIRDETLSIFYGSNGFIIKDEYWPSKDGIKTPFPKAVLDWLDSIRRYVPPIPKLVLWSTGKTRGLRSATDAHELVTALTDRDYKFKTNALDSRVDRYFTDEEIFRHKWGPYYDEMVALGMV